MALFMETEARRGIALLNERRPGWDARISLEKLDMTFGNFCVLGQEFGLWDIGRRELGLDADQNSDVAYGFNLPDRDKELTHEEYAEVMSHYRLLTSTWFFLITELRNAHAQPVEVREVVLV